MTQAISNQAELALASYGTLTAGARNTPVNIAQLQAAGMTAAQAADFALRYPTIIAQYNDDARGTSFSATVFRDAISNSLRSGNEAPFVCAA